MPIICPLWTRASGPFCRRQVENRLVEGPSHALSAGGLMVRSSGAFLAFLGAYSNSQVWAFQRFREMSPLGCCGGHLMVPSRPNPDPSHPGSCFRQTLSKPHPARFPPFALLSPFFPFAGFSAKGDPILSARDAFAAVPGILPSEIVPPLFHNFSVASACSGSSLSLADLARSSCAGVNVLSLKVGHPLFISRMYFSVCVHAPRLF